MPGTVIIQASVVWGLPVSAPSSQPEGVGINTYKVWGLNIDEGRETGCFLWLKHYQNNYYNSEMAPAFCSAFFFSPSPVYSVSLKLFFHSSIWQMTAIENLTVLEVENILCRLSQWSPRRGSFPWCWGEENMTSGDPAGGLLNNCTGWKQNTVFLRNCRLGVVCFHFSGK